MPCVTRTCIPTAKTNTDSCSVKSRRRETPGIERRATLSDKEGKGNKSVRVPKVYSSQRAKSVAERSRCGSRISLESSLQIGCNTCANKQSHEHSIINYCMERKIGRKSYCKKIGEHITQLRMSSLSSTKATLLICICRRHQHCWTKKASLAPMPLTQRGSETKRNLQYNFQEEILGCEKVLRT